MHKTALVTGGAGGIGQAVCRKLAADGFSVYVGYSSSGSKASGLAEEIGGTALKLDVTDSENISEAVRSCGNIDVLVNNAGVSEIDLFTSISPEKSRRILAVDLAGTMECTRAFAKGMISRKSGCIVNISSMWGQVGAS